MSLVTDGTPYPMLLPDSKIAEYNSKLPNWRGRNPGAIARVTSTYVWVVCISSVVCHQSGHQ